MTIKDLFSISEKKLDDHYLVFAVILIVLGIAIRFLPGLIQAELWSDEISWYKRTFDLQEHLITLRGPVYMFLNNIIFTHLITEFTEYKVRIISIVSSSLFIPIYAAIIQRIFKSRIVTLSSVVLSSFNLAILTYTHELKPYTLALLLHTTWFFLVCCMRNKEKYYLYSTLFLIVCSFTTYNMVLLYPVHSIIGVLWYKQEKITLRSFIFSISFLFISGLMILHIKLNYLNVSTTYWGNKYGLFYFESFGSFSVWFFERLSSYFTFASNWYTQSNIIKTRPNFHYYENVFFGYFLGVMIVFSAFRIRSFFYRVTLLVFFSYCIAGYLGIWPFGFFRTNLFMFMYSTIILIAIIPQKIRGYTMVLLSVIALILAINNSFWEKGFKKNINAKRYLEYICDSSTVDDYVITGHNIARPIHFYYKNNKFNDQKNCGHIKNKFKRGMNIKQIEERIDEIQDLNEGRAYNIWLVIQGTSQMSNNSKTIQHFTNHYNFEIVEVNKSDFLLKRHF